MRDTLTAKRALGPALQCPSQRCWAWCRELDIKSCAKTHGTLRSPTVSVPVVPSEHAEVAQPGHHDRTGTLSLGAKPSHIFCPVGCYGFTGGLGWSPVWVAAQELWLPSGQNADSSSSGAAVAVGSWDGVPARVTVRHARVSEMVTTHLTLSTIPNSTFILIKHNAGGILPSAIS